MAQAEQFMLRINTYGPDLLDGGAMPKYRELVEEVITPKFAAYFDKNAADRRADGHAGRALARRRGVRTGVSAIDYDSATALVAGRPVHRQPTRERGAARAGAVPRPGHAWSRSTATWLVDDFTPRDGSAAR